MVPAPPVSLVAQILLAALVCLMHKEERLTSLLQTNAAFMLSKLLLTIKVSEYFQPTPIAYGNLGLAGQTYAEQLGAAAKISTDKCQTQQHLSTLT